MEEMITARRYAATIGFFDGVHQGHRYVIGQLLRLANERGLNSMVITFDRHPRQVLHTDWHPQLLTTPDEKRRLLEAEGVDRVVVLPFTPQLAALSARQFMQQVLAGELGVGLLLTGYDNRFGHRSAANAHEGFSDYVGYGHELGIEVVAGQPLMLDEWQVSSSLVRRMLDEGRVQDARKCLGRPYELAGTVAHGEQIGRRLGFPTANVVPEEPLQLVPRQGVYAVSVSIDHQKQWWPAVLNIGHRPTFGQHATTIEAHLLDYHGDLYGHHLTLRFIDRLRDEQPFPDADALRNQMRKDAAQARQLLTPNP